jgi:predicted enzyme related to lactoylglutathione lyase
MILDYVIVYVQDLAQAQAFYTGVLGLTVRDAQSSPTFVTLEGAGGARLGLQDGRASRLPPGRETAPGGVELSFAVDDVDATYARWQAAGVRLLTPPLDLPFGRYFLAQDPEGHYLSVYRFTAPPVG